MSEATQTGTFPCPGCGSMLEYDPGARQLVCPACGNTAPIPVDRGAVIMEYPLSEAERMAPTDWESPTVTIACSGCGTKTVVPADSGTAECPFCGSRQLVRDEASRTIRPESLIPFAITRKDAKDRFGTWIRKKWFAPDAAKKAARADRIQGVYVPYWTYDAQTEYDWSAEAGTHYYVTETRTVTGSDGKTRTEHVQVQKTSWRPVFGHGSRFFDDVPVNGSRNDSRRQMEKLDFSFAGLVPYRPEYLLGFQAERYTVDVSEGFDMACETMRAALRQDVRGSIVADEVRNVQVDARFHDVRFKHLLAPIWLSSFRFRNKPYRFVVNGQDGTVQGQYPVSPWKVTFVILLVALLAAGAYLLIQLLQRQ